MALQIISVLLFTVFFSEALTLVCYNCTTTGSSETCTQNATCPSNFTQCSYISTNSSIGQKSCAASCDNWSIHSEVFKMSSQCCPTDLCNKSPAADNELTCYTCSDTNCSKTLKCKGDENRCITATVGFSGTNSNVKGCASQNICNNSALVNLALSQGLIVSSVSCCGANLCNNAQSTAQGLFLLVPILSLLFSI
ncbi:phospholipase A2 inhibitor gamma subunit B-like [Megalobrama amblycephala]|uniref:phospholipase A2 inhibitor gamma subunit B-like n=1 Tax=Megalobrama amblycephala TaxID=75352 RepID=UPI0020145FBB|nr:phospholipase A2 inhibitor gamma subunit B-like [Megalobrama amblycephala]